MTELPVAERFLDGGGEATRLIRARDWSAHPLGLPAGWPEGLKTALSLVLNSPESMILLWGSDLTFFFNETYFPLLGPRLPHAMGARFDEVWADALEQATPILEAAARGEKPHFVDLPWKLDTDRGAADTWFSFSYSRVLGPDGEVAGFFIFTNETTERVLADAALRDSQERLAAAIGEVHALNRDLERRVVERTAERDRLWDNSPDLLVVMDQDGTYRWVNPAWTQVLGWSIEALVGLHPTALAHPDDLAAVSGALATLQRGPLPRFEARFRHHDGSYRWISWLAVPTPDGLFGTGRDVTEEKEAAAALLAAEDQLRQAQKLEAVGQLTGGLAHDFNNLLTVIRGSVDLLRRPGLAEERRARYLDAIGDTADRAAKLTGQLLAFARRQALDPETFDAREGVFAIRDMVATLAGPRVSLSIESDEAPCFIHCDRTQFDTALVNMVVNARDAMDGHGTLTIRVAADGDHVAVSLADTGTGIAPGDLGQIFEPFYTTKAVGAGTGLGLSQVFGFAKQSGGEVSVASTAGHGATFTLSLPAVAAPAERRPAPATEAEVPHASACVLVVEDNPEVATFALQAFEAIGCTTTYAPTAAAALAELDGARERYDLVFTDVVMPGMSGIELAAEVARRFAGLPVVLTSGYSDALVDADAPACPLLRKPYSLEELARVVGQSLAA